jgi:hypothetical protein
MKKVLPTIVFFVALISCKDKNDSNALKAINQGLELANADMEERNEYVYTDLAEKTMDPQTAAKAAIWRPRAIDVGSKSTKLITYIDSLKKEIALFKESSGNAIKRSFEEKGNELYGKLVMYSQDLTDAWDLDPYTDNPIFRQQLEKVVAMFKKNVAIRFGLLVGDSSSGFVGAQIWIEQYLNNSNSLLTMAMLNKIQNDILITENGLIQYCKIYSTKYTCGYDQFHTVAVLSSAYVKAGQSIEVSAGVGQFSAASKPRITIDGAVCKMLDDGAAVYSFTAKGKPGNYHVPVTIEFYKPDGTLAQVNKQLQYTIAE